MISVNQALTIQYDNIPEPVKNHVPLAKAYSDIAQGSVQTLDSNDLREVYLF